MNCKKLLYFAMVLGTMLIPALSTPVQADDQAPPVVKKSSWGQIKALYRGNLEQPLEASQNGLQKRGADPASSSRFSYEQCTWYAASEFDKVAPWPGCNWGGNAGTWVGNASAAGWRTYGFPSYYPHAAGMYGMPPGTIVVWTGGAAGHVAVVRYVFQNGIYIQEKNWPYGSGVSGWRLLYWWNVLDRSGYKFSGYIPPWRK